MYDQKYHRWQFHTKKEKKKRKWNRDTSLHNAQCTVNLFLEIHLIEATIPDKGYEGMGGSNNLTYTQTMVRFIQRYVTIYKS